MPKLSDVLGTTAQDNASQAEVTALKAKVAALEAQIKAQDGEIITVASLNAGDLPNPLLAGKVLRILTGEDKGLHLTLGASDGAPATSIRSFL